MIDYLNVPEHLLYQPIEPYSFKVGDRVRVRLNGECVSPPNEEGLALGYPHRHFDGENGRLGTIDAIDSSEFEPNHWNHTHRYSVLFDEPLLLEFLRPRLPSTVEAVAGSATFAACELEPLDGEP
jgi:hypothetical protein